MSTRRFTRGLVAAVGAAALIATASASAAESDAIGCGTVITESVTLTHDLAGCAGDGLLISADNVTLDLGGHSLDGTGTEAGILIAGSHVRVSNGTVRGFEAGVSIAGEYKYRRLTDVGISYLNLSGNSRTGITAWYVTAARVEHNALTHNGSWGLWAYELHGDVVDNDAVGNGTAGDLDDGGISMKESSGTVSGNRALHNAGPGMRFPDPYALAVKSNRADDNAADGITLSQNYPGYEHVVITANTANRNAGYGIRANPQSWLDPPGLPTDGGSNSAWRNTNPEQCLNIDCARNRGGTDAVDERS
jgi:hypothetical protein